MNTSTSITFVSCQIVSAYLYFPLIGVVEARCSEDAVDLLPTLLVAIFKVQEPF